MRTRRSPRNQEILFRELFKPEATKVEQPAPKTAEEIDAMWWIPKTSRSQMKRDAEKKRRKT